ncbi:hypothetical protein [Paeniglutamicibacter cryotolerans]|uniref:Uncharacterized protein n=1 Tax=Paeniglutamicibacter cryotolerans TaxID=670079 RepID=A0A839QQX9_9MICC|nr:hypothetical protein [Paeniglutamicibacter cryotolerans]MBB2996396.1 hypothetical protein [Paeniglutamicibacter cryotolerans]
MRKFFSAIAVVVGLVALLLGVGQRTIWAPPETLTASIAQAPKGSPLTVIESGVVSASDTPVQLTIESKGTFSASLGRAEDVNAWVDGSAHTTIRGVDKSNLVLDAESTPGKATSPNPAGADLFYGSETAKDTMTYRWSAPDDGNWSLLLAANGKADAPTNVTVSWAGNTDTPFSMPLIVVGSLLVLLGLAGLLTRGRGKGTASRAMLDSPRRESRGQTEGSGNGTAKRLAAGATALSLLVLPASPALAVGAAVSVVDGGTATSYPVLMPEQLKRILDSVSTTVSESDKKRDAKTLGYRAAGGALRLRKANYKLLSDGVKVRVATPFSVDVIRSAAVTTSTDFPRNIMIVTAKDNNPETIPSVLALTQKTPWDNYKLVSAPAMLAGATFPGIGVGDSAVQSLKPGDKTLKTSPEVALTQLANVLDNDKAKEKADFADNPYIKINATEQAALAKANAKNAVVKFDRTVIPADTMVLSAPDGGAVVMGQLTSTTTVTPKELGGKVVLDSITSKITGVKETDKGIVVSYGESMLLYVPAAGSADKIRLVAVESITLGAQLKK